jgi:NAD(P)-dependent dehydrogenase (short-subunit alcohol dehydrogenase family)
MHQGCSVNPTCNSHRAALGPALHSTGIGYELARAFKAAPGVSAVIATARQTSAMQGLEAISTLALDVTDSTSIQKGLAHVMEKYGR